MSKKLKPKEELEASRIADELLKVHRSLPLTDKEAKKLAIASKLFRASLEADPITYYFQKHDALENADNSQQPNPTKPRLPILEF